MTVMNSIVVDNDENIKNLVLLTSAPADSGIVIFYSIIDSIGYQPGSDNIVSKPHIGNDLLLEESSAGKGSANDGMDIGLITSP
jgi:hypothetical protein